MRKFLMAELQRRQADAFAEPMTLAEWERMRSAPDDGALGLVVTVGRMPEPAMPLHDDDGLMPYHGPSAADEAWSAEHPIRSILQPPPWRRHRGPKHRRPSSVELVAIILIVTACACLGVALVLLQGALL